MFFHRHKAKKPWIHVSNDEAKILMAWYLEQFNRKIKS